LLQRIITNYEIFAEQKIKLGDLWKCKAGNNFRYFMVYERRTVDSVYKLEDFINIISVI